ncbi:MAG: O-methyltransferase [Candidatus Bipolaricaulota bacterium]|nr:O-methyltransferase [Candidatus Bipolaricaulota bacterium]MDW8328976.1 O-methyltransferase [Candidatus Bipolaricaulota bacterium]
MSKDELFAAVDAYIERLFVGEDALLEAVLRSTVEAGMPPIQVSAVQGKFLYLLAKLCRARRILEVGTLAGYSAIWLARALPPDGRLISLEVDPKHAAIAQKNLERAGLAERVEIVIGPALETLPGLQSRGEPPFDMVFIDADKENYTAYLDWALKLTRAGGLIVADNVIREGQVLAPEDSFAQGVRDFNAALAAEPRVEAVLLQQVGVKGYDGMAIALVK